VEKDPDFAEAWTYLAAAAIVTGFYHTSISVEEAALITERAANKALALNPGSGLALASQAMLVYATERDQIKGFQLIDRAVEVDPDDTTVRLWAGGYHWYWGYIEAAQSHFLYAYTHDPRVGITNGNLGLVYLAQGREDLAAPLLAKATELDWPNHYHIQACLLMMRGDIDAAFAKLKIALASPGTESDSLSWIYELEQTGRNYIENPESADALIAVVERVPRTGATEKARLYLLFDLKDEFFEYLSLSVEEGFLWLPNLVTTLWLPEFRAYLEDPRFLEIMRRDGGLELWEQRGYLDGCARVSDPTGDHLDCSHRYKNSYPK
jgi:tetratricopeptide (TPR) repeat protein